MSTPVSVQSFNKLLPIPGVRFRPLVYDQATGQYIVLDSAGQLGISGGGGGGGNDPRIPDSTLAGGILYGGTAPNYLQTTNRLTYTEGSVTPAYGQIQIQNEGLGGSYGIHLGTLFVGQDSLPTSLISDTLGSLQISSIGNITFSAPSGAFIFSAGTRPDLTTARAAIFAELATLNGVAAGLGTSLLALFDALGNDTGGLGLTQTV